MKVAEAQAEIGRLRAALTAISDEAEALEAEALRGVNASVVARRAGYIVRVVAKALGTDYE